MIQQLLRPRPNPPQVRLPNPRVLPVTAVHTVVSVRTVVQAARMVLVRRGPEVRKVRVVPARCVRTAVHRVLALTA